VRPLHLRHLRDDRERQLPLLERTQPREQVVDVLVGEAGADVADVRQLVAAPDAEYERAEPPRPPSLPLRVARDHELLAAVRLDLQPLARALALPVRALEPLGDDSLELLLPGRLVQRLPVLELLGQANRPVAPVEERLEPRAAVAERQVDERLALELEQVEGLVHDRRPGLPLLHRREAGAPLLVERADLAVEHAVRSLQSSRNRGRDSAETLRQVVAVSADQPCFAAAQIGDGSVAVPLDLE